MIAQPEFGGRNTQAQLRANPFEVHRQASGIQTPDLIGVQAFGGEPQRDVVHQVDDEMRQRFARRRFVQADQGRKEDRPAANQRHIARR